MTEMIFIHGHMRHPKLFETVSGRPLGQCAPRGAWLDGVALALFPGRPGPDLYRSARAETPGVVLNADATLRARLDFYFSRVGGQPTAIKARLEEPDSRHEINVLAYLSEVFDEVSNPDVSGAAWDFENWAANQADLCIDTACELMAGWSAGAEHSAAMGPPLGSIRARAQSRQTASRAARGGLRRGGGRDQVDLVSEDILSNAFFRVRALGLRHPTFAGGMTPVLRREVFDAVDAVTVLPYDPGRDRVMLIEQFRAANYARGDAWPWSVEAIAGRRDPGETNEEAARRETREEGGVTLSALHQIGAFYPSTGALTEYLVSYIGITELPDTVEGFAGLAEEGEDIRVFVMPFDDAMARLDAGEIENATLMISLLQLGRLRSEWRAGPTGPVSGD